MSYKPQILEVANGGTGASTLSGILSGAVQVLSKTTGIDATAVGTTNLYTVPAATSAIVTGIVFRLTTLTAFVAAGNAGVGIAANEDDILGSSILDLGETTRFRYLVPTAPGSSGSTIALATEVIKLGIDVGYTAGSAVMSVDLIGYLIA